MSASRYFVFAISLEIAWTLGARGEPGLDIQDPPGMRAIVTREGETTHVRFVPNTPPPPAATPAADAANNSTESKPAADAAAAVGSKIADKLYSLNLDRPISAVPAFVALDLSPETVAHPSSPRDLAAALLDGVDRNGVLQHGLAIETAPFRLLRLIRSDIRSYKENYWTRFLYNFSFSIATSKASDKSDDLQLALGFSAILYQSAESDPRRNSELARAFHKVNLDHPVDGVPWTTPADEIPDEDPVAKKSLQDAVDAFREKSWQGLTWGIAAAPTWTSDSGKASDLKGTGFSAWTTVAYGLENPIFGQTTRLQLLGHLRYREGERLLDPANDKRTANQDTFIAAARLRLGSADFNLFAETGYVRTTGGFNGQEDSWRSAGGIEKKISENIWLVLSAGEQFGGSSAKENELFAVGSFRVGSSDKPQFGDK